MKSHSVKAILLRLWPTRLLSQIILLVCVALILAQAISLTLLSSAHRQFILESKESFLLDRFSSVVQLLNSTPQEAHSSIVKIWRRPGLKAGFSQHRVILPADSPREIKLQNLLSKKLGPSYIDKVSVNIESISRPFQLPPKEQLSERRVLDRFQKLNNKTSDQRQRRANQRNIKINHLAMTAQLTDGRWFHARIAEPDAKFFLAGQTLIAIIIAGALILLVLVWQIRRITKPLALLTASANDLGRGKSVAPLPENGPEDIRLMLQSFNQMNTRLNKFVNDRTRMLAALSHDLRTPLTSMRLRLEMMDTSEHQKKLLANLEEMQQMTEATVAFMRDSTTAETSATVDLYNLLTSICDDYRELGSPVSFTAPNNKESFIIECRPLAVKRALCNLLDNAIHYGHCATVALQAKNNGIEVTIEDDGPGIDDDQIDFVFEPFQRLEASRNRDTGGVGLGLSIAQQTLLAHGGRIELHNRYKENDKQKKRRIGLKAVIIFPV